MAVTPHDADRMRKSLQGLLHDFRVRPKTGHGSVRYVKYNATTFETLRWISAQSEATPSALARHLQSPPTTITSLLDKLEGQKLISRAPSPKDRRRLEILLTPRGQRALAAIEAEDREICTNFLQTLPDTEREAMLSSLDKMAAGVVNHNIREPKPSKMPKRSFLKPKPDTKAKTPVAAKPRINAMKTEYSRPKKR